MKYEPKILENKTKKTVEFFYDGKPVIFKSGEKRPVDGAVARHALKTVNTGLTEISLDSALGAVAVEDKEDVVKLDEDVDFYKLPWQKLRNYASSKGVFKTGMSKADIFKALENA